VADGAWARRGFLDSRRRVTWPTRSSGADQPGRTVLSTCFAVLGQAAAGRDGVLPQVGLVLLADASPRRPWPALPGGGRSLQRARAATRQHARMARLVGRRVPGRDAVVLDAPERVAYCVAGRPHTIVVTSAVWPPSTKPGHLGTPCWPTSVPTSSGPLPAARAHRSLAAILPTVALFGTGAVEVARLLEMCADDAAARAHGR